MGHGVMQSGQLWNHERQALYLKVPKWSNTYNLYSKEEYHPQTEINAYFSCFLENVGNTCCLEYLMHGPVGIL